MEIVEEAVEAAKENAKMNGLDNCTFWAGDVLKVIDDLGEVPDLIVLDPPRDGVHPKALEKIIDFGVEKMVYIACKPTSVARDLEMLQGRGYQVERIGCVDLFPEQMNGWLLKCKQKGIVNMKPFQIIQYKSVILVIPVFKLQHIPHKKLHGVIILLLLISLLPILKVHRLNNFPIDQRKLSF